MFGPEQTYVGHVRVRGGQAAARTRWTQALAGAELQPSALPPSAVLIVRKLVDPLPRALSSIERAGSDAGAAIAVAGNTQTWAKAARAALGDCHRRAARPLWGAVPADADAVVFDDDAELLACLARDLSEQRASEQWWWHALLRRLPPPSGAALAQLLCERPQQVPAVFAVLAQRGALPRVLDALAPGVPTRVLKEVASAHALPSLARAVEGARHAERDAGTQATYAPTAPMSPELSASTLARAMPSDALRGFLQSVEDTAPGRTWTRERAALLGTALLLQRQPVLARQPCFARELAAWWAAPGVAVGTESLAEAPARRAPHSEGAVAHAQRMGGTTTLQPLTARGAADGTTSAAGKSGTDLGAALPPPVVVPSPADASSYGVGPPALPTPALTRPAVSGPRSTPIEVLAPTSAGMGTELGGLLFLINLMHPLGQLSCQRWPASVANGGGRQTSSVQTSGWARLELVARTLLGDRERAPRHDPMFGAFAVLDGRAATDARVPSLAEVAHLRDVILPALYARLDALPALPSAKEPLRAGGWLACAGQLFITRTHVDLVMDPERADVAVRIAGLDRDPGWVPELGHVVTFHFDRRADP